MSKNIEAVSLKLGTINVHHKRNKMTPSLVLPQQLFRLQSLSVQKTNIPICLNSHQQIVQGRWFFFQDKNWDFQFLQPTLEKSDSLGTKSRRKRLWDYSGGRRSKQTRGIQCGLSQRGLLLTELQIAIRSRLLFQTTKSQEN